MSTAVVASAAGPVRVLQLYTITLWYPREEGAISVLGLCCFLRLIHGRRTCCERFGGSTPRITVVCKPDAVPWTRRIQALVVKGATRYEPWGLLPLRVECRASVRVAGGEPRHVVLQARIVVLAQPRRPLSDRCCRHPTFANEAERIGLVGRHGFPACDSCVSRERAYRYSLEFCGDYTPPPWWTRRPSVVNHPISPRNDDMFIVHSMSLGIPAPTGIFEPRWRWDFAHACFCQDIGYHSNTFLMVQRGHGFEKEKDPLAMPSYNNEAELNTQLGILSEITMRLYPEAANIKALSLLPFFYERDE